MWRWHELLVGFVACAGLGMGLAAAYFTLPRSDVASASSNDNVTGWVWADPIGWISLNDINPGSGGGAYGVNVDPNTGAMNGFGWSNNAGWVCFGSSCSHPACSGSVPSSKSPYAVPFAEVSPAPYVSGGSIRSFHGWAKVCNEGNAGWISLNCSDLSPSVCGAYNYHVPFDMTTHFFEDTSNGGSPTNGTSFAWNGNSDGTGFGYLDFHLARVSFPLENTENTCTDGIDTDVNGAIDCADPSCATTNACQAPPPPLAEHTCTLGSADSCCANHTDDDGDSLIDCDDFDCQANSSACTVAWLKTQYGNVYAQKGIQAIAAPMSQYNASYCLSFTDGSIVGFASQSGCQSFSDVLSLPNASRGYKGSLGSIDLTGIERGSYGRVIPIADGSAVPSFLNGNVYTYVGGGILTIPAISFQNSNGPTGRGNGLLYVKGADLRIAGDSTYASASIQSYLRNLASFGVIVTKDPSTGLGGNIMIDPTVHSVVGAYFAESSVHTGASSDALTVYGLLASREISFERTSSTLTTAAETVIFDGRAVANPPPGMQDVGKSLPTTKDAF